MFSGVTRAAVVSDLSPARRWHIVLARDRRFDGAFVYAVRSTGIYCRPSCPSRRPRRALVSFFPIPEAAEQAGLDRKSTRLNSSHLVISYAVFCLKKKKKTIHSSGQRLNRVSAC